MTVLYLYGNSDTGAGWRAHHGGRALGDGWTVEGRTLTEALWRGCWELRCKGAQVVRVFSPCNGLMTTLDLRDVPPAYQELIWIEAVFG